MRRAKHTEMPYDAERRARRLLALRGFGRFALGVLAGWWLAQWLT